MPNQTTDDQTSESPRNVTGKIDRRPDDAHPGKCIGGFDKPTAEELLRQLGLRAARATLDLDAIGSGPHLREDEP